MHFLKRHPFAVEAWFKRVVAISFAFPSASLRPIVPDPLQLDTHGDFGFVTVALVWTRALRPAGFPAFLGQDFLLAGYRVFTRLQDDSGRRLRGLKILRSETDKRRMVWAGNLLTDYKYRHVRVRTREHGSASELEMWRNETRTLRLHLGLNDDPLPRLPEGSPFPDWRTARQFAGPMPFTFSPRADGKCLVIEGQRTAWEPRPIQVKEWHVAFFEERPFRDVKPVLANAFAVDNISYRWQRGRLITPGGNA
jgi:hypothetical protein